jgi:hypothetical protein
MLYSFLNRRHKASVKAVFPEPTGLMSTSFLSEHQHYDRNKTYPPMPTVNPRSGKLRLVYSGMSRSAYLPSVIQQVIRDRHDVLTNAHTSMIIMLMSMTVFFTVVV